MEEDRVDQVDLLVPGGAQNAISSLPLPMLAEGDVGANEPLQSVEGGLAPLAARQRHRMSGAEA